MSIRISALEEVTPRVEAIKTQKYAVGPKENIMADSIVVATQDSVKDKKLASLREGITDSLANSATDFSRTNRDDPMGNSTSRPPYKTGGWPFLNRSTQAKEKSKRSKKNSKFAALPSLVANKAKSPRDLRL